MRNSDLHYDGSNNVMNRILFTWELGGNLGHLSRQLMIARVLKRRGNRCLFAVRDADIAAFQLSADGFEYAQAPFHCSPEHEPRVLASYADILSFNGYASPEQLSGLVDAWFELFGRFHPDVIVTEYSPTAVLSATLAGIPVMRIDTGFGLPPDERPFPGFRAGFGRSDAEALAGEQALLTTVNTVCGKLGRPGFKSLQEMLATDRDLLTTVPELDHYQGRRFGSYIGPLFNITDGRDAYWPDRPGRRVFVYLRPFEGLETVLQTLADGSFSTIAVVTGIAPELIRRYESDRFRISAHPLRVADLLPGADLAITHGGHGLASACLHFGIPMLLIPQVIEQLMTARNFERLGTGIGVNYDQVATGFTTALNRLLTEPSFGERADVMADRYSDYDQELVICNLADTIEGIMRRSKVTSVLPSGGFFLPVTSLPGSAAALVPFK